MKTLDELIRTYELMRYDERSLADESLYYLKEYKEQKKIWSKLYQLFEKLFYGVECEYSLDKKDITNTLYDAYMEFDND